MGIKDTNWKNLRNLLIIVLVFGGGVILGQKDIISFDFLDKQKLTQQNNLPNKLDYRGVEEVYSKLKNNFDGQLEATKLEDGLKEGLVNAAGDPYTEYLTKEESKDFEEGLTGSFEGIGAELGKDNEAIVIISPIAGFPAEEAGLRAKDIISEINGQTAFDISVSEAVKRIRGPKGTKVKLGVIRDGKKLDFEIMRDQIKIPSVTSEIVQGNIGILKISRFGEDTVKLAREAALDFKSKNVRGVVLDLRGNPGGLLNGAVGIASIWMAEGSTILQEKRDDKVIKTYFAEGNPTLLGVPTVVLIDEGSASASEIVAGALKDNKVATIIGVKSYGKGSVQEINKLSFGGSLKVTIARWYTPNGRNIDKEGIEPDQKVEKSDEDIKAKRDPQKDSAIKKLTQ